jgi:hypothetical protein
MRGIKDRELKALVQRAEELGCAVSLTRGNHLRIDVPGGGCVHTSSTPSDWRSVKNTRAQLRRAGLEGI